MLCCAGAVFNGRQTLLENSRDLDWTNNEVSQQWGGSDFWELDAKCENVGSFLAVVVQRKNNLLQKIIGSNCRLKK